MKHYSDESWVDYVRGVAAAERREEMSAHLQEGCPNCRSAVKWFEQIQQVAALDRTLSVPMDVVAAASSIFPRSSKNDWIGSLQSITATIVFQSGLGWQAAGVRSTASPCSSLAGQMVFEAGDYRIHVKIEGPTTSEPGEIVGEIKNSAYPADRLEGVVVQAITSGRASRETTVNQFGEFLVEYPFVEDTVLRLAMKEKGLRIDLKLDPQQCV
jgi:anti-sigma factor RsiW